MKQLDSRSWELDVIRGVLAIAFAIVFFLDRTRVLMILFYVLGAYLILDGVVGVYTIARYTTKVEHSRRKWVDYALSAFHIVIGLLCFSHTRYVLLFLLYLLAPGLSPALDETIASCLAHDPQRRPADGAALVARLSATPPTRAETATAELYVARATMEHRALSVKYPLLRRRQRANPHLTGPQPRMGPQRSGGLPP